MLSFYDFDFVWYVIKWIETQTKPQMYTTLAVQTVLLQTEAPNRSTLQQSNYTKYFL